MNSAYSLVLTDNKQISIARHLPKSFETLKTKALSYKLPEEKE